MSVIANPTLTGNELNLARLQVGDGHYRAPFTRKNLLDNWYFVGGGDQQGGGIFPINQRKQTTTTGSADVQRMMDRWALRTGTGNNSFTINANGITIVRNNIGSFAGMSQAVEGILSVLAGATVTFSVLIDSITADKAWMAITNATAEYYAGTVLDKKAYSQAGLHSLTYTIPTSLSNNGLNFWAFIANNTTSAVPSGTGTTIIRAAKLELGSTQTLAHLENGVWVLNEIPDYTTQLLRCQRFYRVFTSTSASTTGYGYSTNPKNLRPEMRATPSTGSFTYGGTTYYYLDANL